MNCDFTIVIPLYNKEKYIARAIESVLNQSYTDFTIIVVDDGSSDLSASVVNELYSDDSRVELIKKENGGESSARNVGIDRSEGDYICFLDADDEWYPNFLSDICALINKYPEANCFATGRDIQISENNFRKSALYNPHRLDDFIIEDIYLSLVNGSSPFSSSSSCIKRSALIDVGKFPEGIILGPDILMWILLFEKNIMAVSSKSASLIHQEADGRVCNVNIDRIGEREFSKYLTKKNNEGQDSFNHSRSLLVSKHLVDEATVALRSGHKILAREIINDKRVIYNSFKAVVIKNMAYMPSILIRIILGFKSVRV